MNIKITGNITCTSRQSRDFQPFTTDQSCVNETLLDQLVTFCDFWNVGVAYCASKNSSSEGTERRDELIDTLIYRQMNAVDQSVEIFLSVTLLAGTDRVDVVTKFE